MLTKHMPTTGFALTPVRLGVFLVTVSVGNGQTQGALTWPDRRDKFAGANPTLIAGRIGIDESTAAEITAYLHPNPNLTGVLDQIDPFTTQPPLDGQGENSDNSFRRALPSGAVDYLHERELQRDSAQQATAIRNQGEKERTLLDVTRNQALRDAAEEQVFSNVDSASATNSSNLTLLKRWRANSLQHGRDHRSVRVNYLNLIGAYWKAAAQMNMAVAREVIQ